MADFKVSFDKTSLNEGIYSNDPTDRGKETVFGISRNNFPNWEGWVFVDEIKLRYNSINSSGFLKELNNSGALSKARFSFYKENFWNKLVCDNMPQDIADELFDTSVNMGVAYGSKCLQRALNKLNRNQIDYPDIEPDGKIGPNTIKALNAYMKTNRPSEQLIKWLLKWMNYFQMERYNDLSDLNPEQEKFIPGWTERS